MRHPAGHRLRMRCLEPLPQPCGVARLAARSWAVRVVLVWAVLAGLFFMHGAASPADGCRDGASVTALTATTVPSPSRAAAAGAGTEAGQFPVSAAPAFLATTVKSDPCCGRMPCLSRQPRQGFGGAFVIRPAAAVIFTAALMPLPRPAPVPRRAHPPGTAGLPLPLFLGVSRT